jgi:small-conductance mechanosensitive channel
MRQIRYELVIDYDEDIKRVKHLLLEALNTVEEVMKEPASEVLVTGLANGDVVLQIFCWTELLHQAQLFRLHDSVLTTLKDTLVANNIQLSMQTQKVLLENIRAHQNGALREEKSS